MTAEQAPRGVAYVVVLEEQSMGLSSLVVSSRTRSSPLAVSASDGEADSAAFNHRTLIDPMYFPGEGVAGGREIDVALSLRVVKETITTGGRRGRDNWYLLPLYE